MTCLSLCWAWHSAQASLRFLGLQVLKQDMAGGGPAAIDGHISDGFVEAKGLQELPCFRFDLFASGVEMPSSYDESVPIYFQVQRRPRRWEGTVAGVSGRHSVSSQRVSLGHGVSG